MAKRSGPDRVGHEPPLANARTGGSLAETEIDKPGKSTVNLSQV